MTGEREKTKTVNMRLTGGERCICILYQLDIEMEIKKISKKEITRREMNTRRETNTSSMLSRESKAQIYRKMLKHKADIGAWV